MRKIMITADSSADFFGSLAQRYSVRIAPLHVIIGGKSYTDTVDISPSQLFSMYDKSHILPKTSAVSLEEYHSFFSDILNEGYDEIIHIAMSSHLSSTCQNARIAGENLPGVHVIDSLTLTSCMGLLIIKACELRDMGYSAKEICHRIETMRPLTRGGFILDSLEFIHKGGRCSGAAALGANLLGLKVSVKIENEGMSTGKKYRGRISLCQLRYAVDVLEAYGDKIDTDRAFVTATADVDPAQIEKIKNEIGKHIKFKELLTATAGCVVSAHCGKNTVGVLFMLKEGAV